MLIETNNSVKKMEREDKFLNKSTGNLFDCHHTLEIYPPWSVEKVQSFKCLEMWPMKEG